MGLRKRLLLILVILISCSKEELSAYKKDTNVPAKDSVPSSLDSLLNKKSDIDNSDEGILNYLKGDGLDTATLIDKINTTGKQLTKGKSLALLPKQDYSDSLMTLDSTLDTTNDNPFKDSKFSYSYPDSVELGGHFTFKMAISRHLDSTALVSIVLDSTPRVVSSGSVKASDRVEVKLVGDPKIFTITPISSEEQSVVSGESVKWSWLVNPLEEGSHTIFVSIRANIKVHGESVMQTIDSHEASILIYVKKRDAIKRFLEENWQWFFGTLIIPLIIFFNKRRKNEQD